VKIIDVNSRIFSLKAGRENYYWYKKGKQLFHVSFF